MNEGEKLFHELGYNLLWKKDRISVIIEGKEHTICFKDKFVTDPEYDGYNKEIKKAFYYWVQRGTLKDQSGKNTN